MADFAQVRLPDNTVHYISPYKFANTDTRNNDELPSYYLTYYKRVTTSEFKQCNKIGVNTLISDMFCNLFTIVPWTDNTGGRPIQIAVSPSGKRAQRVATSDSAWGSWILLPNQDTTYSVATTSANGLMSSAQTQFRTLPTILYSELPSQSTDNSTYFREWLAYVMANYGTICKSGETILAQVRPNSTGTVLGSFYGSTPTDPTTGLPQYCSFIYVRLGNSSPIKFGTNNYVFYCSNIDTTYSSLPAQSGGTAVSLVTTGEKYLWNNASSGGTKVFITTPTVPYSVGDLWVTEDTMMYCTTAKASGSFDEEDWEIAVNNVTPDALQDAIKTATEIVTSSGTVVWHDTNNDGIPDEFLVLDVAGLENATKVFKFNGASGLTYSSTGYNGTYTTIINQNGEGVASYLKSGTLDASLIAITNFTASMIQGGILTRGGLNNVNGTIIVNNAQGIPIAEVNKDGFKFYGAGNVGQRPYIVLNDIDFFAGYDANNTQLFKVVGDEFRFRKIAVSDEIGVCNEVKLLPITITENGSIVNEGVAIVGI